MNTPPPRRRKRRTSSSSEPEYQSPRRRKKKPGASSPKKKKQSVNNVLLLKVALFSAGALVLVAGIFMFDWKGLSKDLGLGNSHEKILKQVLAIKEEQADIFASIKDPSSARAALPRMKEVTVEIAKAIAAHKQLKQTDKLTPEEDRDLKAKYDPLNKETDARLRKEMERIMQIPGMATVMAEVLQEIRFAQMEAQSQIQKDAALAGFNASGYSPVTDSTSITPDMRIEVLHLGDIWRPGKVTDVAPNGNVKVNLDIHKQTNAFDQYYPRNKLRIPD
ncbi:hypothetical protein [Gimesia sp.]|uniref:hypothetical protein n=1 Tax=Gimesia sp. TaxID=2024833 RepID=UPI000C671C95|nr:hypothetical protein [Gimesia sp.]MAX39683.1 hypothetical protein [Gimesia sp.]HBL42950.1 hypothetical protein [Planctomycetaceae bacterium]